MVVILGAGFVGQRLADKLGKCTITHRHPASEDSVHDQVEFRLDDLSTWTNLPNLADQDVVMTMPVDVVPLETLQKFHSQHLGQARSIIVLGSAGIFKASEPAGVVNEESLRSDIGVMGQYVADRAKGEDWLIEQGATVLALSGIVGDTRAVNAWVMRGYLRNGLKHINLVYVHNIIEIIMHFFTHPSPGERFIVNGGSYLARDVIKHFGYPPIPEEPTDTTDMVMLADKIKKVLPEGFKFFTVFDEQGSERESLKPMWEVFRSKHLRDWFGSALLFGGEDFAKAGLYEEYKKDGERFEYSWKFLSTCGNTDGLEKLMDAKGVLSFDTNASPFGIVQGPTRLFCFKDGDFVKGSLCFNCRAPFAVSFGFLLDDCTRAVVLCSYGPDGMFKNFVLVREEVSEDAKFWKEDDSIVPEREAPANLVPQSFLSLGSGCEEVMKEDAPPFPGYSHLDGVSGVHRLYLPQGLTLVIPKLLTPKTCFQLAAWCERPDGIVVQLRGNYTSTTYDSILHNVEKVEYKV